VIPVPWLLSVVRRRQSCLRLNQKFWISSAVSPVVIEKSYFAPTIDTQGSEPCRGADLWQCRDPQGSGGVVPRLRIAGETGLESSLFLQVPRRELEDDSPIEGKLERHPREGHDFQSCR